jgi:hypothetical protein
MTFSFPPFSGDSLPVGFISPFPWTASRLVLDGRPAAASAETFPLAGRFNTTFDELSRCHAQRAVKRVSALLEIVGYGEQEGGELHGLSPARHEQAGESEKCQRVEHLEHFHSAGQPSVGSRTAPQVQTW